MRGLSRDAVMEEREEEEGEDGMNEGRRQDKGGEVLDWKAE